MHTIVTEIKSKKAVPNTNQAVYNILAVDEQTGARYMVDVCVSLRLSNEGNAVLFCVDRIFVSYLEEARGRVVMEDLDGDGVLDGLRTEGRAYAPPFPYHSMEHGRRSGSSGLGTGAAWYSFVERDLSGEANPAGAARLNAGPFQELFRRVAVPALEELDFRPSERR